MTEDDVPVLTEVVSDEFDSLEALAREIERTVLQRLGPEVDRVMDRALDAARAELKASLTRIIREALVASLAGAGRKPE